jgi:L-asparaginase
MSGTGNGDSFLKINAVRTAAAISRYSGGDVSLQTAVSAVAGPYGQLQQSAGDRWGKTGEGEGGIIGVECRRGKGYVVFDHNCGGMFRAWVDERGEKRFAVFQDELRY